jgi:hypothetical protein
MPDPIATQRNSQTSTPTREAPATADLREETLSTGNAFNRHVFARNVLLSFAAVVAGPALAGVIAQEPKAQQSRAQRLFDPKNSDLSPLEKATSQQQERGYFKCNLLEPLLR